MVAHKFVKLGLLGFTFSVLSACNASQTETSVPNSGTNTGPNTGDNVERVVGSGNEQNVGFSTAQFPSARIGVVAPNTAIGDANDLLAAPLSGASGVVPISVLTFNIRNSDIRSVAGKLISGGDNLVAVIPTPNGMIPASGSATMRGSGDVIYVNTPTSQVFTGVMDATVTANFTQESVNITMSNPVGQIDGVAYSGGGIIAINELALSGGVYQDDNRTTGSVTGFSGAADLNSGSQIVNALGVIGGPNAEETAAIAQINDRSNGTAIMRITAQE